MGVQGVKIRFNPTHEDLIRIRTMAETGLPILHIARCFGMGEEVFSKFRKQYPALEKAIQDGQSSGNAFLTSQLWNSIREGNIASIIFACKVRLHMSQVAKGGENESLPKGQKSDKINFNTMTPIEAARVYQQVMKGEK